MSSSDIGADLSLQICLRQRVADTLQDRLHWALSLQRSLSSPPPPHLPHDHFQLAAHNAITAVDAPCRLIFGREPPPPPRADIKPGRPPPRPKLLNSSRTPNPTFLYIKSPAFGHDQRQDIPHLLRCPQCLRTAFSTLQGLLNHARIAHRLEWGTHEDCVHECAVPQPGLDTSAGVEVGLGPAGILPGLRSIFRMAVGLQANQSVNQSLGLHEESSALAPFLGKSPIRRGIKIYGRQGDTLDIVSLGNYKSRRPRFALPPRRLASQQVLPTDYPSLHQSSRETTVSEIIRPTTIPPDFARSRFHFTTRIIVTDRSIWVPPHRRGEIYQCHSHRWMISVHSPSYARDLTTILKNMIVVPLGVAGSTESGPTVDHPPYVVVGASDRPFLARVELFFNGIGPADAGSPISETQKIILEHWVELDPIKSPTPVTGEEQIIDIELDRRTIIGPMHSSHAPIDSKALWDVMRMEFRDSIPKRNTTENEDLNYSWLLKRLAVMIPLVKGEFKNEKVNATDLPYKLRTQSQHYSLNMGRRKAIEWRRAKILQDAYLREVQVDHHHNDADFPSLSVGDVYLWLSTSGHSPRPSAGKTATASTDGSPCDSLCPVCGLAREMCKPTAQSHSELETLSNAPASNHDWCTTVREPCKIRKFPFLYVQGTMAPITTPLVNDLGVSQFELRRLLLNSNPKLVHLVKAIVRLLAFPTFCTKGGPENADRIATEEKLGPYALLSLAVESFIRALVLGGLEMSYCDIDLALGKKRRRDWQSEPRRSLTPSHILRAVARLNGGPIFECLARIGLVE